MDDEQCILRNAPWRIGSQLHEWFYHSWKDREGTQGKDHQILENCRETQLVFQIDQIWIWCYRNPNTWSKSWKWRSQNGRQKDQDYSRMERAHKTQRSRKFHWVCQLLLSLYKKLQPHYKTPEQTQRKSRLEMGKQTMKGIPRIKEQHNQGTYTGTTTKKRTL